MRKNQGQSQKRWDRYEGNTAGHETMGMKVFRVRHHKHESANTKTEPKRHKWNARYRR